MKQIYRFFNTNCRPGPRVVKTGIAVTFCIVLSHILKLNQPFIAVIATVISMGKSIDLSLKSGKNKMIGVIIGTAVGTVFASLSPGNAGLSGIGIILSLYLCHLFRLESAGVLSSFSFAAVMFASAQSSPWKYALTCMGAALLGIGVAVIVNLTVMPPNYAMEIKRIYAELKKKTIKAIDDASARKMVNSQEMDAEIQNLAHALRLYISEAKILRWNDDEVFLISSNIATFRLILDELKAIEVMALTEDGEPSEEILTVYHYHMKRMRDLFQKILACESM
ncbi:MAG: FUSC family protein [Oscillospiraceae bacterium]|jgi:uncharacterized membrane protein YgaE (UPF0421/DUF939 family)